MRKYALAATALAGVVLLGGSATLANAATTPAPTVTTISFPTSTPLPPLNKGCQYSLTGPTSVTLGPINNQFVTNASGSAYGLTINPQTGILSFNIKTTSGTLNVGFVHTSIAGSQFKASADSTGNVKIYIPVIQYLQVRFPGAALRAFASNHTLTRTCNDVPSSPTGVVPKGGVKTGGGIPAPNPWVPVGYALIALGLVLAGSAWVLRKNNL